MSFLSDGPVTVLLIGTADTKADELGFLRAEIEKLGHRALVMDVGVLGVPAIEPDIDNHRVAVAAGATIAEVAALGGENQAMQKMAQGAARVAADLCAARRIHGVLAIGGTMGTDLAPIGSKRPAAPVFRRSWLPVRLTASISAPGCRCRNRCRTVPFMITTG